MKTVFTNAEIPHLWAHARQERGRGNGALSFEGRDIFSYGTVIGRRLGYRLYAVVPLGSYSATTSGHQGAVLRAIPGDAVVVTLPAVGRGARGMAGSERTIEWLQEEADSLVAKYRKARKYKDQAASRILDHGRNVANIMEHHGEIFGDDVEVPGELRALAELLDSICDNLEEEVGEWAAKREVEREAKRKRDEARLKAKIEGWKAGGGGLTLPDTVGPFLRIERLPCWDEDKGDGETGMECVATSSGAWVPLRAALLLYRANKACPGKLVGKEVGGYRIIANDETHVTIGCHRLAWEEVDRVLGPLSSNETTANETNE